MNPRSELRSHAVRILLLSLASTCFLALREGMFAGEPQMLLKGARFLGLLVSWLLLFSSIDCFGWKFIQNETGKRWRHIRYFAALGAFVLGLLFLCLSVGAPARERVREFLLALFLFHTAAGVMSILARLD